MGNRLVCRLPASLQSPPEQPVSVCLWLLSAEKQNEKEAQVIRNVPEYFPSKSCTARPEGFASTSGRSAQRAVL